MFSPVPIKQSTCVERGVSKEEKMGVEMGVNNGPAEFSPTPREQSM